MDKTNYLNQILETVTTGKGDSDKHLLTLFSIGMSISAKKILELGVREGSTSLPLLLCASLNGGSLHSVDINPTKFICPDKMQASYTFQQSDALAYLKSASEEVVKGNKKPFDLIYLDDWHAYEHVKQELEYIDKMVTPKSIILVHDLMYATAPNYHADLSVKTGQWANGGPYRAVAELDSNFWEFSTIPVNNGLTIVRKKYSSKYVY
jgi:predicted O-methyltransferase YrrM